MFLDENILNCWWKNKDSAFTKKKELVDRFDEIVELFKVPSDEGIFGRFWS